MVSLVWIYTIDTNGILERIFGKSSSTDNKKGCKNTKRTKTVYILTLCISLHAVLLLMSSDFLAHLSHKLKVSCCDPMKPVFHRPLSDNNLL